MLALEKQLLQGGNADMNKIAMVAFNTLLQDVPKIARDTQSDFMMKEVAQLIAAAQNVAL